MISLENALFIISGDAHTQSIIVLRLPVANTNPPSPYSLVHVELTEIVRGVTLPTSVHVRPDDFNTLKLELTSNG